MQKHWCQTEWSLNAHSLRARGGGLEALSKASLKFQNRSVTNEGIQCLRFSRYIAHKVLHIDVN